MFNAFALDGLTRELAIIDKEYEIAIAEATFLEAAIDAKLKINLAKSEYKVMTESTSENAKGDLIYLFNEAGKEAEEQKEGVFTKIKQTVINAIVKIWNAIQKVFTKKDTAAYEALKASQEKIEVPMDVKFFANKSESVLTSFSGSDTNDSKVVKALKVVGIAAGAAVAAGGVGKILSEFKNAANRPITITKGEGVTIWEKLKNLVPNGQKSAEDVQEDKGGNATGENGEKKGLGSEILHAIHQIIGFISKGFNHLGRLLHLDVIETDAEKTNPKKDKKGKKSTQGQNGGNPTTGGTSNNDEPVIHKREDVIAQHNAEQQGKK